MATDAWNRQNKYADRHPEVTKAVMDAFEDDGGCGHDLGLGWIAIVKAWEKLRTPELVKDLENV